MWNKLKDIEKDDLLEYLGLQTRRSAAEQLLPAMGIFGVGLLIGAGIGLLLAPKAGSELRDDLRQRMGGRAESLTGGMASSMTADRAGRSA